MGRAHGRIIAEIGNRARQFQYALPGPRGKIERPQTKTRQY